MNPQEPTADARDERLPPDVATRLAEAGVTDTGEVALRRELERRATSYTLFRLSPAAARKWKARYRIMLAAEYLDCQTVAEAYARAVLATMG